MLLDRVAHSREPEFLEARRNYYERETAKNVYPEKVSDLVAWKLMLRLLRIVRRMETKWLLQDLRTSLYDVHQFTDPRE